MIPYIGGKSYLAKWIISQFPDDYKDMTYCEVFGGAGWVLFKKEESNVEIYNDLNKELVNLFRVIRDNHKEFSHRAEWSLHSREMYNEAVKRLQDDDEMSKTERAVLFTLKRIQTFSASNSVSWGYKIKPNKMNSGKWLPFLKRMELINARLKRTQIECLDFENVIEKYDRKTTLFYLDPPYVDAEFYYKTDGVDFTRDDHKRLAEILTNIEGKFVLSYYENPLIRRLYKGFKFRKKIASKHSCGVTRHSKNVVKPKSVELLIRNY